MLLDDLAMDIVSYTSELLDGRIVNVMNTEGVIIASTDPKRVGTFHQGALNVALSGKPVSIRKDQLDQYPGAREGYNMPLRVGGSLIGVVGVYGDPEQIRSLAHLVEVYAEKCYQLEAVIRPQYSAGVLRFSILEKLIHPTQGRYHEALELMNSQRITLTYPLTIAVLDGTEGMLRPEQIEKQIQSFLSREWLRPDCDVWGVVDERLVLVLSEVPDRRIDAAYPEEQIRISISEKADSFWDIRSAFEQAMILNSIALKPCTTMEDISERSRYLMHQSAALAERFLDEMLAALSAAFSPREVRSLLISAQSYYENNRSVTRAAEQLFVHKNTLQYRLRRLIESLDLADCNDFQQEYTIRLLLEHYKRKQGLRVLK